MNGTDYDYIVVGSGAGGGPLAANLARAGFEVLLLEAGGDPCAESDLGKLMYEVPIFHGLSTEFEECAWDYFVRHYADDTKQKLDSKYVAAEDGIFYPRAGTLGGCTAHNAMITVIPQDSDWDNIARITGDSTWAADKMHAYFTRLENCTYKPRPGSAKYYLKGLLSTLGALLKGRRNPFDWTHGHGFQGWLTTSETNPLLVLKDWEIVPLLLNAVADTLRNQIGNIEVSAETLLDPNDARSRAENSEGVAFTPLAVDAAKRNGPRDYLQRTQQAYPKNLTIQLGALVSSVLFEKQRAIGVEFLEGRHLYQADPRAQNSASAPRRQVRAREVILAGGAFNSPQLLKLSGVGPRQELESFGLPVVADLPGVGENLQDRYEVGVVSEFAKDFKLLQGATFLPPPPGDPFFDMWKQGKGIYGSKGALIGIIKKSAPNRSEPDLYVFALPGFFKGYFPGYSKVFERFHNRFTWAILKAHTNNTAGTVKLRSKDPTERPFIDFHYFSEGNDTAGADLDAVVEGVQFVRDMNRRLGSLIKNELVPGLQYESPEKLREFIQNEAWGHHASCTNKIGADTDRMAVLDSRFRVRVVQGLRVVDASVFPKIPGYFIVTPVYIISEKASDVIAEDAQRP
jgi:choline dehydrogenase